MKPRVQLALSTAVLVGALGAFGASYASQTDTATTASQNIKSGEFRAATAGTMLWMQEQAAGTPTPTKPVIDMNTYAIVPGDTVVGEQGIKVAASAPSIKANWTMTVTGLNSTNPLLGADGVVATYEIFKRTAPTAILASGNLSENMTGPNLVAADAPGPLTDVRADGNYVVRYRLAFPNTATSLTTTEAVASLGTTSVLLSQEVTP